MLIRDARQDDLPAILEIYNQVIRDTTAIYDENPSTLAQRQEWFAGRQAGGFPVLVAEDNGAVIGFASYGTWRARWGYRYSVEHSVHVAVNQRGKGIGVALMKALIPAAQKAGLHVMIGAIDADNEGSIRFHERLGFTVSGRYPEVAHKFGRWLNLVTMQLLLDPAGSPRD